MTPGVAALGDSAEDDPSESLELVLSIVVSEKNIWSSSVLSLIDATLASSLPGVNYSKITNPLFYSTGTPYWDTLLKTKFSNSYQYT